MYIQYATCSSLLSLTTCISKLLSLPKYDEPGQNCWLLLIKHPPAPDLSLVCDWQQGSWAVSKSCCWRVEWWFRSREKCASEASRAAQGSLQSLSKLRWRQESSEAKQSKALLTLS